MSLTRGVYKKGKKRQHPRYLTYVRRKRKLKKIKSLLTPNRIGRRPSDIHLPLLIHDSVLQTRVHARALTRLNLFLRYTQRVLGQPHRSLRARSGGMCKPVIIFRLCLCRRINRYRGLVFGLRFMLRLLFRRAIQRGTASLIQWCEFFRRFLLGGGRRRVCFLRKTKRQCVQKGPVRVGDDKVIGCLDE
jgi:hypothetical protein